MTSQRQWLVRILCSLCLACGTPRSDNSNDGGMAADGGTSDAGEMTADSGHPPSDAGMMSTGIPPAGTNDQVDCDFLDIEPNNTPQEATPLGTSMGNINVWVNGNDIGGPGNTADYLVFNTPAQSVAFTFNICISPSVPFGATLWAVVDGAEQLPPLGSWNGSAGCVSNTSPPGATTPLAANTEYLFGLTATGGAGNYGA
jgi:hypothetical protein